MKLLSTVHKHLDFINSEVSVCLTCLIQDLGLHSQVVAHLSKSQPSIIFYIFYSNEYPDCRVNSAVKML